MSILTNNSDSVRASSVSNQETKCRDTWQTQMKSAIRDVDTLLKRLGLSDLPRSPKESKDGSPRVGAAAVSQFPVFVPLPLLSRMQPGDLNDPLLRQVLPFDSEDESPEHYTIDPLGESSSVLTPGLLQKYKGRVLMVATGACAVHCRYCFRRHYPYQESPVSLAQWEPALGKIAADDSIEEVILSGGDPLTIVDAKLAELVKRLEAIEHVKRLRIHTRLPIMIPDRITETLTGLLQDSRMQAIVVIHSNHANEFDAEVKGALGKLRAAGVLLLNQTVLLSGINDNAKALVDLSKRLLECNVLPYYLHQVDPVTGVSHFEVERKLGEALIAQMRAELPGYGVPRYVKEIEGELSKSVWA